MVKFIQIKFDKTTKNWYNKALANNPIRECRL